MVDCRLPSHAFPPTIRSMSLSTPRIHPALAPYIREIRVDDPGTPVEPQPYKVLPGPFPVLGFQYRGRLEILRESRTDLLGRSGITGLQSTFRWFQPRPDTRSVLVVLAPHGAYRLLGVPMDELANAHVPLSAILSPRQAGSVEDRIEEADADGLAGIVQSFFLGLLEHSRREPHPALVEASQRILEAHGAVRVEALARELAISRRQLERLFRLQVGVGPKELASLARFDRVLKRLPEAVSWADLALETDHSDQSHLIRSFARRTGQTPGGFPG